MAAKTISKLAESDADFIVKLRIQEPKAFKELMLKYTSLVYRQVRSHLGNMALAEDMTQEIFLKIHRALPNIKDTGITCWVVKVARNHCIDELRKQSRRISCVKSEIESVAKESVQESNNDLPDCLNVLQKFDREVTILKTIEGLSYKEIAVITGKAEGTLRNIVWRAVRSLRKEIMENEL